MVKVNLEMKHRQKPTETMLGDNSLADFPSALNEVIEKMEKQIDTIQSMISQNQ